MPLVWQQRRVGALERENASLLTRIPQGAALPSFLAAAQPAPASAVPDVASLITQAAAALRGGSQNVSAVNAALADLSAEQVREYRGTLTEAGRESPYRNRSVEENLDLLRRMRAGEFPDGARTLRAKIDMASGNINLRDPALYRIKHMPHPIAGAGWCIYPMYDFAHALGDAIENLPEREQLVLSLYYEQEMNLREIGAVLNVSESRVCQIHGQAMLRLRSRLTDWRSEIDAEMA